MTHDAITALELQNRRLKQLLVVVVLLGAAAGIRAQVVPAAITGDRFVLIDAQSRTRATLELAPAPAGTARYPVLTFLDTGGQQRLRLGLAPRGPMLELVDEHGRTKDYLAPAGPRPLTQP